MCFLRQACVKDEVYAWDQHPYPVENNIAEKRLPEQTN